MFSDGMTTLDASDPRNLKPVNFFHAAGRIGLTADSGNQVTAVAAAVVAAVVAAVLEALPPNSQPARCRRDLTSSALSL
jgi:hypothetical protein